MKDIIKIIRHTWVLKPFYLAIAAFAIIISLLEQTGPFAIKYAIEALQKGAEFQLLAFILILSSFLRLLSGAISNIAGHIGDRLGARLQTVLSQKYYDHLLQLPIGYFDNQITGQVTGKLERGISTITQFITAMSNNFISFFLTSAITLGIMSYYSWPVAVALASLFPFYLWLTAKSSKRWQAKQGLINTIVDTNSGRFVESVTQIRVVKSFVQEVAESRFFAGKRKEAEALIADQSRVWHYYDFARLSGLALIFGGIFAYIVWQAYRGDLTIAEVILLLTLAQQAQWPLFASSFIVDQIQRAAAGSRDYFEVMETKPSIVDKPGAKQLKISSSRIEYKDVAFKFNEGDKEVLSGVSFVVKPGSKVAFVGESGQGKTTLSNLLLRFYEVSSGSITIDGQNIADVTQASLRSNIGVVFQEPALFSGTVVDNIKYGTPKATKEQVIAAAKAANAHDFIEKLAKGYDSEIGERGVKLSGGQKQRLAIARAILKNPPILVLDEATSSLDSKAEREVQTALETLMAERTTLIIAHRLSTIQNVDIIVGLRDGGVAELGSPEELATRKEGIYAELLDLQNPTKANKAKLQKYDIARV